MRGSDEVEGGRVWCFSCGLYLWVKVLVFF